MIPGGRKVFNNSLRSHVYHITVNSKFNIMKIYAKLTATFSSKPKCVWDILSQATRGQAVSEMTDKAKPYPLLGSPHN